MSENVRLALIDELLTRNDCHVKILRTRASKSRQPMPKEDRQASVELGKANVWLKKARESIALATEGREDVVVTRPIKKPILGVRCHKCGRIYMGVAMTHLGHKDIGEDIRKAIEEGDELFITDSVTLQMCECKCHKEEGDE